MPYLYEYVKRVTEAVVSKQRWCEEHGVVYSPWFPGQGCLDSREAD